MLVEHLTLGVNAGLGVRVDEGPDEREERLENEGGVEDVRGAGAAGVVVGHGVEDLRR